MKQVNGTMMRRALFTLFALGLVLGTMGMPAAAADFSWRMAIPWPVPAQDAIYREFIENVREFTDGRVEIKYFPDGQMGTHDEIFHSVQDGSIEIAYVGPYVNLVPGGALNWMPWTVTSWEAAAMAFDREEGILWEVMEKAYNEVGMSMLFVGSYGPYGLGNNVRPITKPEDLRNLKMRVSASLGLVRMLQNIGRGTGMTVETIPWGDLYDALGRGVVDGCWSMWPSLIELRHAEVLKYYTDLNFAWDVSNVVINKDVWDSLPADVREGITRAARITQEDLFTNQQRLEQEFIAELEAMEDFEIYFLSDEEREAFREASDMGPIWDELVKPWLDEQYPGQNMTEKVQEELEKIHQKVLKGNQ